jgi:predicted double-glycine peptidase
MCKKTKTLLSVLALPLFLSTIVLPLQAGEISLDVGTNTRVYGPLKSFTALRDENLVKQAYDYSCGAAALATLLTYGLDDPVTEQEILKQVLATLPQDEEARRKKEGLSLLDLQKIAQIRGHRAQGFRLAPEFLSQLQGPVMVFIKPRGYEHFAVLKGVQGNRVYLADPSLGNVRMSMSRFLSMWLDETGRGIIFVVERTNGSQPQPSPLQPGRRDTPPPEMLSARQFLEGGTPYVQFPELVK